MPEERKPVQTIPELLAHNFETARKFTLRLVGEFDEETALWRPTEFNNNALWIAGHILGSADHFGHDFGLPKRDHGPELSPDFAIGGCYHEGADYPSLAEIAAALEAEIPRWVKFISALTAEELARPFPGRPSFLPFISDAVPFMSSHELIHTGQLFFLRRGLGCKPLA
jgi:hypothetical protein